MICFNCGEKWLEIGNPLAGVFQQYLQQCDCDPSSTIEKTEGKKEPPNEQLNLV